MGARRRTSCWTTSKTSTRSGRIEFVNGERFLLRTLQTVAQQTKRPDRLIVLDAVRAGKTPGSMVRLEGSAVPSAFQTKLSPHQTGIADLLATLTFLGKGPKDVLLLGVEPVRLELDLNLSPEVEGRVAELGRQVLAELAALGITPKARAIA